MHYLAANRRHILTPKHPASLLFFFRGWNILFPTVCLHVFCIVLCNCHMRFTLTEIFKPKDFIPTFLQLHKYIKQKNILDVFHALFKTYSHKPLPDRSGVFGNFLHLKDVSSTEDGERHFFFLIVSCWCPDFSLSEHCPPTVQPS